MSKKKKAIVAISITLSIIILIIIAFIIRDSSLCTADYKCSICVHLAFSIMCLWKKGKSVCLSPVGQDTSTGL